MAAPGVSPSHPHRAPAAGLHGRRSRALWRYLLSPACQPSSYRIRPSAPASVPLGGRSSLRQPAALSASASEAPLAPSTASRDPQGAHHKHTAQLARLLQRRPAGRGGPCARAAPSSAPRTATAAPGKLPQPPHSNDVSEVQLGSRKGRLADRLLREYGLELDLDVAPDEFHRLTCPFCGSGREGKSFTYVVSEGEPPSQHATSALGQRARPGYPGTGAASQAKRELQP
jgi:hypothetical protein